MRFRREFYYIQELDLEYLINEYRNDDKKIEKEIESI